MTRKLTFLENLCKSLGENNNAAYAVVAVATAKGIFRPMFTMMDKHQDYESRKYTALREGLTEVIAIPCYITVAKVAGDIIAPMMCHGKSSDVKKTAAKTLSFVGVCAAALVIIPAACSALINPIMELRAKHIAKKKKKCEVCSSDISNTKLDIKENVVNDKVQVVPFMQVESTAPITKTYNSFLPINYNSSLTIGGGK